MLSPLFTLGWQLQAQSMVEKWVGVHIHIRGLSSLLVSNLFAPTIQQEIRWLHNTTDQQV